MDNDTLLAASSPQSSRAAARQKKKVAHESFAAASTIPTEVVTHLYHRGKLVKVIQLPKKSKRCGYEAYYCARQWATKFR